MTLDWNKTAPECVVGRTLGPVLHSRGLRWDPGTSWSLDGQKIKAAQASMELRAVASILPAHEYWNRARHSVRASSYWVRRSIQEYMWVRHVADHHGHAEVPCTCDYGDGECRMPPIPLAAQLPVAQ